ncbi:MAG: hypothetical protein M1826_003168 [Phylliscum demangeonii]|nr:MAG: hypothetical protein M1826_003168 [Phylliscum demangeonii]
MGPPMLAKIKKDLFSAMKSKDTNRLNVLRTILTETTNAAKSANPIETDIQLLSLLRRRVAMSEHAAVEFADAQRHDLQQNELAQLAVLDEYISAVEVMDEDAVRREVWSVADRLREGQKLDGRRMDLGTIMRECLRDDGPLKGKPVERAMLAKIVREVVGAA